MDPYILLINSQVYLSFKSNFDVMKSHFSFSIQWYIVNILNSVSSLSIYREIHYSPVKWPNIDPFSSLTETKPLMKYDIIVFFCLKESIGFDPKKFS